MGHLVKRIMAYVAYASVAVLIANFFISNQYISTQATKTVASNHALSGSSRNSDEVISENSEVETSKESIENSKDTLNEDSKETSNKKSKEPSNETSKENSSKNSVEHSKNAEEATNSAPVKEPEESLDEISEKISEGNSEESFEESSNECSDENSKESSEEISEEIEEISENSEESSNCIPRTQQEQQMFEIVMYAEGGGLGTPEAVVIANAWVARNKIQQAIDNGESDPFMVALNPDHYQGVSYDSINGWHAASFEEGIITAENLGNRPIIHEISQGVLDGTIPSPIYDWDCCLSYDYFGFDSGIAFAEDAGVEEYFEIGNGIYFPSKCWTEKLTWYCQNF